MAAAHEQGIPMGIVPLGTANIVARELGLPAGWRRATQRALEHFPATRAVDLARVNDGYMALAAGIGFDAMVMRHTPPVLKYWLGRAAYFLAGAWWLPRAPLFECTIRADGEETQITAVVVLVVNAGMLGAAPLGSSYEHRRQCPPALGAVLAPRRRDRAGRPHPLAQRPRHRLGGRPRADHRLPRDARPRAAPLRIHGGWGDLSPLRKESTAALG